MAKQMLKRHHRSEHEETRLPWQDQDRQKETRSRHGRPAPVAKRLPRPLGSSLRHMREAFSRDLTRFGLVVFARVKYVDDDDDRYKIRPVVVVGASEDGTQVFARPISSSRRGLRFGLPLSDWEEAGLSRPCAVQHRVVSLSVREDFSYTAGSLTPVDAYRVEQLMVDIAA